MFHGGQRGLRPGGLKVSRWAEGGPSWTSRGHNQYIPRSAHSTSTIVPVTAIPSASADNGNWWENTPPPRVKGSTQPTPIPTPTVERRDFSSSRRELRRYVQIVRRMKWKLPYLEDGYRRAIGAPNSTETAQWAKDHPAEWEAERQEAELHFKLDFFEYYMLLERALVHLLGVFGVSVSGQTGQWLGPGTSSNNNANRVYAANHSYHQNVLTALESKESPLFEALGSGDVRMHLRRAKDLRNRWKYVEAQSDDLPEQPPAQRAPLESYELVAMFDAIFAGFNKGYMTASDWVDDLAGKADMVLTDAVADAEPAATLDEEEYNFMFDAMDWEAV